MTDEATAESPVADDWGDDRRSVDQIQKDEQMETLYDSDDSMDVSKVDSPTPGVDRAASSEPEPNDAAAGDHDESERPDSYTAQEWAALSRAGTEIQRLRADEKKLAEVGAALQQHGGDIVKACGGDRAKAAAFRSDLKDLVESIDQRRRGEAVLRQRFAENNQARRLSTDFKKMTKVEPALADPENRTALATWLIEQGHKVEDVERISSHQAAVMWKTMQSAQAAGGPAQKLKVPSKTRKAVKRRKAQSSGSEGELRSPGSLLAEGMYGADNDKPNTGAAKSIRSRRRDDPVALLYD